MTRIHTALTVTAALAATLLLASCAASAPPTSDIEQTTTPMTMDSELHFETPRIALADGPTNQLTLETTVDGDATNANISLATITERSYLATSNDGRQATFVHQSSPDKLETIQLPGLASGTTTVTLPVTVQGFSAAEAPCQSAGESLTGDETTLCALDALDIASTSDLASVEEGPLTLTLSRDFGLGNGSAQVRFSDQGAAPETTVCPPKLSGDPGDRTITIECE